MRFPHLLLVFIYAARSTAYLTPDGKLVIPGASSYNGLNLTPQMGWNTW